MRLDALVYGYAGKLYLYTTRSKPLSEGAGGKDEGGPGTTTDPPPNSVPKRRLFVAAPRRLAVYVDLFLSDVLFDDLFGSL